MTRTGLRQDCAHPSWLLLATQRGFSLVSRSPGLFPSPGAQILSGGRMLSLPTPRLLDSGTYTCVASSAVGEDRREATVEVRCKCPQVSPAPSGGCSLPSPQPRGLWGQLWEEGFGGGVVLSVSSATHCPGRGGEHLCHRQPGGDTALPGPRGRPPGVPLAEGWDLAHTEPRDVTVRGWDCAPGDVLGQKKGWEGKGGAEHLTVSVCGRWGEPPCRMRAGTRARCPATRRDTTT